ncbi:23S rRNA (guanosine(2553)-2'-O)-methyltransferase RlmP-like isoform X2 [Hylaeus volcanicus]|uniref:23S rRNA (guanosine(2553)-2'-O)-methyltransferase RlmP-like isoform X2 n=1 Tax=Hylaeus volcanicus TaxID=313075 RepID=UPI0023B79973|nr:23S rRNA (guanosine(2553)-2'-O)-methyltransferase RlmP-like isoform X2 [Hylaeus volcanicus]
MMEGTEGLKISRPQSYLILNNIGKKNNFGLLLRSAAAFGIEQVYIVGEKKMKTFGHKLTVCESFDHVRRCLGDKVKVCGIEINETAKPVSCHPFSGSTAFMLGNEGTGMSEKQVTFCDEFVYIPQYSCATASLNVAIAGSIVFHHFASNALECHGLYVINVSTTVWASFLEAERMGNKFTTIKAFSKLEQYLDSTMEEKQQQLILRRERHQKKLSSSLLFDSLDEDTIIP